ncbi:MAG: hypothetical protein ACI9H6_000010 [Patiriisocius sp.]|jgi:hypothetical protein
MKNTKNNFIFTTLCMLFVFLASPQQADALFGGYDSVSDAFDGGGPGRSSNDGYSQGPDPSSPFNGDGNAGYSTPNQARDAGRSYCGGGCSVSVHQDTDGGYNTSISRGSSGHGGGGGGGGGGGTPSVPACVPRQVSCTGIPSALCGDTYPGTRQTCGGSCSALEFPDTECRDKPLPGNALTIIPDIVRVDGSVVIGWDTGTNHQTNCTLEGAGLPAGFTIGSRTGSVTIDPVTGPHRYTLTCGPSADATETEVVRIVPIQFET